jgi:hypothetical protein
MQRLRNNGWSKGDFFMYEVSLHEQFAQGASRDRIGTKTKRYLGL